MVIFKARNGRYFVDNITFIPICQQIRYRQGKHGSRGNFGMFDKAGVLV